MNTWKNLEVWHGNQKSYYGKAKFTVKGYEILLKSYDTIVAKIDAEGNFVRLWDGYSPTTARHINSFRVMEGFKPIRKAEWDKMEVGAMV